MFNDIGGKLMKCAFVLTIIGIISSIIWGIILMLQSFWIGLLVIVLGVVFSWLSSWALYAFGEAVDHIDTLARQNDEMIKLLKAQNNMLAKNVQNVPPAEKAAVKPAAFPARSYTANRKPEPVHK